jgi:hypothetical protein
MTPVDPQLDRILSGILEYTKFLLGNKKHPLEVLILRGHLLVEREVHRLVNDKFQRPKVFDLSRMPFAAVARLAEALYGSDIPEWILEDTKDLNTIRNSLAHHLVDDTLAPRIKRFTARFHRRDKKTSHLSTKTSHVSSHTASLLFTMNFWN